MTWTDRDDHDESLADHISLMEEQTMTHPDYPPPDGNPQADRCVCGGIRHWHAVDPHGCDDCDCTSFQSSDDPSEAT